MKTKFTLLFVLLAMMTSQAQLVISEISYNPPESGTDSLEYIELYNSSDVAIDLTGYIIADNSMDTLTGGTIEAGGYIVAASNVNAMSTVLGVQALSIPNIALRNAGEEIAVLTPDGSVINAVEFSRDAPWPTFEDGTSGEGASIELCNLEADNTNPGNWRAADNDLGVTVNDKVMKGTPGAANTTTCDVAADITANSDNTFTPASITINVGESLTWTNGGGFHNVNGSQDVYPDNPESFSNGNPSGEAWVFTHEFTIAGEYTYQCDPHATQNMIGTVTVLGEPEPMFPVRTIADIKVNDANGTPILLDSLALIEGVAHGTNFRDGGLQFTIIDDNGDGIGVFSEEDFGITYEEGMRVKIGGTISFFRGLTQINPAQVELISTGNTLTNAIVTDGVSESTESQLVISSQPLTFVDPSEWGNGNDFGFNATMTDGTNTYNLRIDNDSPLFEASIPETPAVVTGIGGQFDNMSPFDEGYQLSPRYASDFDPIASAEDELKANISVYPNPVTDLINIESDVKLQTIELTNSAGQLIMRSRAASTLDVSGLQNGMYFLKLISDDQFKVIQFTK